MRKAKPATKERPVKKGRSIPQRKPAKAIVPIASNGNALLAIDAKDRPFHTIRYGDARGQIWKSESEGHVSFTLTVDRCVRHKSGNDEVSHTFSAADVRHLAKVTLECRKWIDWQGQRLSEIRPRRV
jgi:hypothetical protein